MYQVDSLNVTIKNIARNIGGDGGGGGGGGGGVGGGGTLRETLMVLYQVDSLTELGKQTERLKSMFCG